MVLLASNSHFRAEKKARISKPIGEARKPWIYVVSGDRTVAAEVRVKRDESRSETDFEVFGSLWGSVATGKTAWKLGIFWPREAHLIDLH